MSVTFKNRIAPIMAERLEAISKVLADTNEGLTGSEIDHLLLNCDIPNPLQAINPFKTETQMGEQHGLMNLLKGLYGTIRNPLADTPTTEWDMTDQVALDILTMISLVHRKLDHVYHLRT